MKIVMLGSAQDAGLPQIGCECANCQRARRDPGFRRLPPSIAVIDDSSGAAFIADATPAIAEQIEVLGKHVNAENAFGPVSGLLITHAHLGHYPGLLFFGREAGHANHLPVWTSHKMGEMLAGNRPFSHLVNRGEIALQPLKSGHSVALTPALSVTPFEVPHRNEDADTLAFIFESNGKRVCYMPDHDVWTDETLAQIATCDHAIVDGTFFSRGELPKERMSEIGHPPMDECMQVLKNLVSQMQITFTHLNHSNPAADPDSDAAQSVSDAGFHIASEQQVWQY